jgi:aldehyde dehydrogenase (NAD+)
MLDRKFLDILGIQEKNYGMSTGLEWWKTNDQGELNIYSPTDGRQIASVYQASEADYEFMIKNAGRSV